MSCSIRNMGCDQRSVDVNPTQRGSYMYTNTEQKKVVIDGLRRFIDLIKEMLTLLGEKRSVSADEKDQLQALLASLKEDMKSAVKHGTIGSGPQTEMERLYFVPTVQKALANLTVAVNSH